MIADEAIDGLIGALDLLLPEPAPGEEPTLVVTPRRIAPTGVGGFVGFSDEPAGEIHGRRVEAAVYVTVRADPDDLPAAVTSVTRALVGPDRSTLAAAGIQRVALAELGPQESAGDLATRTLEFDVEYEYLRLPDAGEGAIESVPLDLDVSAGAGEPRTVYNVTFVGNALDTFDVVDDPAATASTPSQWQYEKAEKRVAQRSRIGGGPTSGTDPSKPGTQLVLRTKAGRPPVRDLILRALVGSDDDRGIGLVYRWQDVDNFYFFLMHASGGYRLLARKVNGVFAHLETQALDAGAGFTVGGTHGVKLVAAADRHEAYVDGVRALAGVDSAIVAPGRVGFLSHRNEASYFYGLELTEV